MKYFYTIIFICTCLIVKSQTYYTFPLNDAIWVTERLTTVGSGSGYYINYTQSGDTSLNNVAYKKIFKSLNFAENIYAGALREVNRIVYFYPVDSLTEYVLYNFNKGVGDTIQNPYTQFSAGTDTLTVALVDSVYLEDNQYHKRQWLVGHTTAYIIEGLGSSNGLLAATYNNYLGYAYRLNCFKSYDSLIYEDFFGFCLTALDETPIKESLEIFPNPTTEYFSVKSDKPITSITLFNLNGSRVFYQVDNGLQNTISTQNLPVGMYILAVGIGKKIVRKKIIIAR